MAKLVGTGQKVRSEESAAQVRTELSTYECDYCHKGYEFEDDAVDGMGSAECLPDGYFLGDGTWMCDDCGSCPECGRSLDKEPQKRGPNAITPRTCRYCVIEEAAGAWPLGGDAGFIVG